MNTMKVILNQIRFILEITNYNLDVTPNGTDDWTISITNPSDKNRFSIIVHPDYWVLTDTLCPYPVATTVEYETEIYSFDFLTHLRLVHTNNLLEYYDATFDAEYAEFDDD